MQGIQQQDWNTIQSIDGLLEVTSSPQDARPPPTDQYGFSATRCRSTGPDHSAAPRIRVQHQEPSLAALRIGEILTRLGRHPTSNEEVADFAGAVAAASLAGWGGRAARLRSSAMLESSMYGRPRGGVMPVTDPLCGPVDIEWAEKQQQKLLKVHGGSPAGPSAEHLACLNWRAFSLPAHNHQEFRGTRMTGVSKSVVPARVQPRAAGFRPYSHHGSFQRRK